LGFSAQHSNLISGGLFTWYFVASFIPWALIDSVGRRKLLLVCISLMSVVLFLQSGFVSRIEKNANPAMGIAACAMIFLFMGLFTIGFQAVVWVYPSEILPLRLRIKGSALSTAVNWLCNYLVVQITPVSVQSIGYRTYIIFAALNASFVPVIYFTFPENTDSGLAGETGARFRFEYTDDTVQEVELSVKNWWTLHWLNRGPIQSSYHTTSFGASINHNLTQIHHWSTALRTHAPLRSITLPPTGSYNRLHLFALSVVPSAPLLGCESESNDRTLFNDQTPLSSHPSAGPRIIIRRARATTKLYEARDRFGTPNPLGGAQLVEVTLANMRPTAASANPYCWSGPLHVWVYSGGMYTVKHGEVGRVMPGDEVKARVWVRNFDGVRAGSNITMRIEVRNATGDKVGTLLESDGWPAVAGIPPYEESKESLERHETPLWWDDAKFGIFIHWGIYSVPAWSPKGYYAAWYQWWLHNPPGPQNDLWRYHKRWYGEDFVYDDFIPDFTASEFNASEWIQLFSDAGAKYFVLVTVSIEKPSGYQLI
ncbi:hypothetical protein FRC06_001683, partial [Ceratobasidium sp. 370]